VRSMPANQTPVSPTKQACKNLNMNQAERRAADADTAGKIDAFIQVRRWCRLFSHGLYVTPLF